MKKSRMVVLIILNIVQSFLLILNTLFIKKLIDSAVNSFENKLDGSELTKYILIVLGMLALQIIVKLVYSIIRSRYIVYLEINLKKDVFTNTINKEYKDIQKIHSGKMSNIYLTDVNTICLTLSTYIPNIFLYCSRFIFAFIALIYLQYKLLLVLLIVGVVLFIFARLYSKKYKTLHKKTLSADDELNSFMQESYENARYIKAMTCNEGIDIRLNDLLNNSYKMKLRRNMFSLIASNGINIVANLCYVGTMCFAAYLIYKGEITYGSLTALVSVVSYFESPFTGLAQNINNIYAYKASLERINELKNLKNEEDIISIKAFKSIEFKNMSFGYDKLIYKDFNYIINKNDIISIKGPSGVGKTTLLNLLLGLVKPDSGEIIIHADEDIKISSKTRSLFSLVPQENILFSGSIRENILLFHPHATDEMIIEALKKVNIYDEISLDYIIKERGAGLSLGQIQRILIAIALLKDSPIILMDEFSSALDEKNEQNIVDIIKDLNKTIIFVSHKNIKLDGRVIELNEKES